MKKLTLLTISLLFLSACSLLNTTNVTSEPEIIMEKPHIEVVEEKTMESPDVTEEVYISYTEEKFNELKGNESFALFFHAGWCPTCRKLDNDIKASVDDLASIKILKIDYDTSEEMKKEYGIRIQHTVVFFNEDGSVAETDIGTSLKDIKVFFNL